MDLLVRGGTVVTQNADREVKRADLLLRDGRIEAIQHRVKLERPAQVIDARGKVVIPGLIQSHIHLCQTLFRGLADDLSLLDWLEHRIWPLEAAHDDRSLYASARLGIAELIRGGTTCIQDMGTVHHTDEIFRALAESGLRAVAGKCMMDRQAGLPRGLREASRGGRTATLASVRESNRLCDYWHGLDDGRLRYAYAPRFVLSCTQDLLREVAGAARQRGVRVHTHGAENRDEVAAVRGETGMGNIAYLDSVGLSGADVGVAHCVWLDPQEERILAQTGTHVLHCPSANLKLGSGVARIPQLLAQGISVSVGADGAPCNNNLDAFGEMRLAALVQKPRLGPEALPARSAFDLLTLGGAAALGLEDEIGSLEEGKRADLTVVDLDQFHVLPGGDVYSQLVYGAHSSDVTDVVVAGRWLLRSGELMMLDEQEVRRQARGQIRKLLARAEV